MYIFEHLSLLPQSWIRVHTCVICIEKSWLTPAFVNSLISISSFRPHRQKRRKVKWEHKLLSASNVRIYECTFPKQNWLLCNCLIPDLLVIEVKLWCTGTHLFLAHNKTPKSSFMSTPGDPFQFVYRSNRSTLGPVVLRGIDEICTVRPNRLFICTWFSSAVSPASHKKTRPQQKKKKFELYLRYFLLLHI